MSTVSGGENMAQPIREDNSYDQSVPPMKRKRGRPRKDEISGSEPNKRGKRCTIVQSHSSNDRIVGQEVSCSFNGVFDAGYLLTAQVGISGPILMGMVFDPRLCVPVSAENDVAPHLPMLGRNGFSPPVEECFITHGADSSKADIAQKAEGIQHIESKKCPITSSLTSHVQTDLQPNIMEVTPSQNSFVPPTISEKMEPQNVPKTLKLFFENAATETFDQSPLTFSHHPQSQANSDCAPISAGLSGMSTEAPAFLKSSNGYDLSVLSVATSSEESKPYNVSVPSEVPSAMPLASCEPLNIPKEALPMTAEASLDVSNEAFLDIYKEADSAVLKLSEASAIAEKFTFDEHKSSVVFESTQQPLEQQTLEIGDSAVDILSPEKSSQKTEADELFGDYGSPGRSDSSG